MTTPDAITELPDLDLRLRRVDGTWHLECRSLDMAAEVEHGAGGLHAAARQLQAAANDEAKALAAKTVNARKSRHRLGTYGEDAMEQVRFGWEIAVKAMRRRGQP